MKHVVNIQTGESKDVELTQADIDLQNSLKVEHDQKLIEDAAVEYRRKRAEQYIKRLGSEPDFITTVGDIIDALIDHAYGDATKLDVIKTERDKIKTEIPKPT